MIDCKYYMDEIIQLNKKLYEFELYSHNDAYETTLLYLVKRCIYHFKNILKYINEIYIRLKKNYGRLIQIEENIFFEFDSFVYSACILSESELEKLAMDSLKNKETFLRAFKKYKSEIKEIRLYRNHTTHLISTMDTGQGRIYANDNKKILATSFGKIVYYDNQRQKNVFCINLIDKDGVMIDFEKTIEHTWNKISRFVESIFEIE